MTQRFRDLLSIVVLAAVVLLAGCATLREGAEPAEPYDPLERMNRAVFRSNRALDRAVIKPVAEGYRKVLPEFVRDRVRAFLNNLTEPRIFINDLLQVRLNSAGMTFARFLMNSTAGIGGLFDIASKHNLPRQSGDFGQTLYMWGLGDGPYLVLPIFGPSNVRDAIGLGVDLYADTYTNPVSYLVADQDRTAVNLGLGVVDGVDLRSRNIETLDAIEQNSLDFYAQLRSIVYQHRHAQLRKARGLEETPTQLLDPEPPER
jgi:phospholipid-binding lipoprotein MlaA